MAEAERVRLLHKARLFNNVKHAVTKAQDAKRTRAETKQKIMAAVLSYLKKRVERGKVLSAVEVKPRKDEEDVKASVLEHAVMEGNFGKEVYADLMDMMTPKWAAARTRC